MRLKGLLFLSLFSISSIFGQKDRTPNFFGINPSVTVEPFYDKGELDINILPFVYQKPIGIRTHFRITTIVNLGIRNSSSGIGHIGFESAFPIFLKKREAKSEITKGFFVAPNLSLTRNLIEEHNNIGLWLEPGYHLLFENKFAMSFGLQLGATYFLFDNGQKDLGFHFGVKVILGLWR